MAAPQKGSRADKLINADGARRRCCIKVGLAHLIRLKIGDGQMVIGQFDEAIGAVDQPISHPHPVFQR